MASNQFDIPHLQLQQAMMTSHHPHPTTAATTMANHNECATSSLPKFLLPINRRKQTNRLGPAVIATSTSIQTSHSNHNHIQTQQPPSIPQHKPEPSDTADQIFSTSLSLALVSNDAVVCATIRKMAKILNWLSWLIPSLFQK